MWTIEKVTTVAGASYSASTSTSRSLQTNGLSTVLNSLSESGSTSMSCDGVNTSYAQAGAYRTTTTGNRYSTIHDSTSGSDGPPTSGDPFTLQTTAYGTGASVASTTTGSTTTTVSAATLTGTGTDRTTAYTTRTASTLVASVTPNQYVPGTYATTTTAAYTAAGRVAVDHYRFASHEQGYQLRLDTSFAGWRELTQFAQPLDETYTPEDPVTDTYSQGLTPTSTFANVVHTALTCPLTSTYETQASSPQHTTELALPLRVLPNHTADSQFLVKGQSSYTAVGASDGTTSYSQSLSGSSMTQARTLAYDTSRTVPTFVYDARGRITGSSAGRSWFQSTQTAEDTVTATSGGDPEQSSHTATTGHDVVGGNTYEYIFDGGVTSASGYSQTSAAALYSATSMLAQATVLEATFDPAVRFGTDGKYDQIQGPGNSVFYPYWSQVWRDLWMPMTYGGGTTTTYQSSSTVYTAYGSYTYSYEIADGPTTSATYSWSESRVSVTTASLVGTSTATGSASFGVQPAQADGSSYSVSRGPGADGAYVVGGTQWNDQPAQLWLGGGIWQCTSYDVTGGSSTTQETITAPVSVRTIAASVVVAARPLPAWGCVTTDPHDPCITVVVIPAE